MSDDLFAKMTLEAVLCATQLDGLVVEVNGLSATCDVHTFGINPTWSKKESSCLGNSRRHDCGKIFKNWQQGNNYDACWVCKA